MDKPSDCHDSSLSSPPASSSLDTWTEVEPEPDEEIWIGQKTTDELTRDEDFFLVDSYLFACALNEERSSGASTEESVACAPEEERTSVSVNGKRTRDDTEEGEMSKRTKS